MGRKNKYDTHVKPFLADIKKWVIDLNEGQIAKKLGITQASFDKYKKENEELREALLKGKQDLILDLKDTLKKKALGYYYTETKTYIRDENGKQIKTIEKHEKYAQPDTGAIHLLLKNLDESWHNDDSITIEMKRLQAEIDKEKLELQKW